MQGLMSELEAVNKLLAVAGDSPVQTLEDQYVQSKLARQILTRTSRRIQEIGWWFNEEESVSLIPDIDGLITLPVNAITALPVGDAGSVVQRGRSMYNRSDRTYQFDEPLKVDMVLALEWEQLPQQAREYISDAACSEYNRDYVGDLSLKTSLDENEANSYRVLKAADTDARDINLLMTTRVNNIAFRNRRG